jgi:hypothetical protein
MVTSRNKRDNPMKHKDKKLVNGKQKRRKVRGNDALDEERERNELIHTYTLRLLEAKAQLEALERKEYTLQQTLRDHEEEAERTLREAESEYTVSSQQSAENEYSSFYNDNHTRNSQQQLDDLMRQDLKHENSHLLTNIKQYIADFMKIQQSQQIELERMRLKEGSKNTNKTTSIFVPIFPIVEHNYTSNEDIYPMHSLLSNRREKVSARRKEVDRFYLPDIHEKPMMADSEWVPMFHAVR